MEIFEVENAPLFRATPGKDVFIDGPGENTTAIGAEKISRSKRPAYGDDAVDGEGGIVEMN